MKKFIVSLLVLGVGMSVVASTARPPSKWSYVTPGMSRSEVYSFAGQPDWNNENTKGGVRWRSDAIIGRWEFDVFFRADDTVGTFGRRWRWNY
jgi:hypothetical protein